MTTRQGLLTNVLSNPKDDLAKLVYADWLEEHDLEADAELIRVGIRLDELRTVMIAPADAIAIATSESFRRMASTDHFFLTDITDQSNPNRKWGIPERIYDMRIVVDVPREPTGIDTIEKILHYENPDSTAAAARCRELQESVFPRRIPGYQELYSIGYSLKVAFVKGFATAIRCTAEWWIEHGRQVSWHPDLKNKRECPETAEMINLVLLTSPFNVMSTRIHKDRAVEIRIMGDDGWRRRYSMRDFDLRLPAIRSTDIISEYLKSEFPGVQFSFPTGATYP